MLSAGEGTQIIKIRDGVGIGGIICFDSIYDELTLQSVRDGADIICLSTNDSWFVDSKALYIHNAHAQLRAIENGRYVARAANTGISTSITPRGEVTSMLEPMVEGKIVFDAYATERVTLFGRIGNLFVYVLLIAFFALFTNEFAYFVKKYHNKKTQKMGNS